MRIIILIWYASDSQAVTQHFLHILLRYYLLLCITRTDCLVRIVWAARRSINIVSSTELVDVTLRFANQVSDKVLAGRLATCFTTRNDDDKRRRYKVTPFRSIQHQVQLTTMGTCSELLFTHLSVTLHTAKTRAIEENKNEIRFCESIILWCSSHKILLERYSY